MLLFLTKFSGDDVDFHVCVLLYCLTDIGASGLSSPCHSPKSRTDDKSQSPTPVPTMLVMSGGEGYIDFRVGSTNAGNVFFI